MIRPLSLQTPTLSNKETSISSDAICGHVVLNNNDHATAMRQLSGSYYMSRVTLTLVNPGRGLDLCYQGYGSLKL